MATKITGGTWRGRVLSAPEGNRTRPTSARIREALFNILGQRCDGWRVADLYAGSGSVGLEALSRGAIFCRFVENDRTALTELRKNLLLAEGSRYAVDAEEEQRWRSRSEHRRAYDLLFVDPPFTAPFPADAGWLDLLAPGGVLVVQFPSRLAVEWSTPPDRIKRYGESSLAFWTAPTGLEQAE